MIGKVAGRWDQGRKATFCREAQWLIGPVKPSLPPVINQLLSELIAGCVPNHRIFRIDAIDVALFQYFR
jgi:hypothetical protein